MRTIKCVPLMYIMLLFVCTGFVVADLLIPPSIKTVQYDFSEESLAWTLNSTNNSVLLFGLTQGHRRIRAVSPHEYLLFCLFFWHKPPPEPCLHSTGNNPLAKRAAISQPVKTGHILFCVGLTLSSPKLCSPLVTSQAWWNLYWRCLKGLELIHCFFLTAQFWIGPRCRSTGCPAGAELSCQYYPHCSF